MTLMSTDNGWDTMRRIQMTQTPKSSCGLNHFLGIEWNEQRWCVATLATEGLEEID